MSPGASIPPKAMMHFPNVSDSPVSENHSKSAENCLLLFPKIDTFPHFSEKMFIFPLLFTQCSLFSFDLCVFDLIYVCFLSPYSDHDAFYASHITQYTYWTSLHESPLRVTPTLATPRVARSCYYQLRQHQVVSITHDDVIAVLVRAFITCRIDHCCSLLVCLRL